MVSVLALFYHLFLSCRQLDYLSCALDRTRNSAHKTYLIFANAEAFHINPLGCNKIVRCAFFISICATSKSKCKLISILRLMTNTHCTKQMYSVHTCRAKRTCIGHLYCFPFLLFFYIVPFSKSTKKRVFSFFIHGLFVELQSHPQRSNESYDFFMRTKRNGF